MKILKKRGLAYFFDAFIVAFIIVGIQSFANYLFDGKVQIQIPLIILFFIRDYLFKNASLGKKIFGLRIYTTKWEKPDFLLLLKRSFFISTMGYVILHKAKFVDGNTIAFFDYEREYFGTFVIDKKIYRKLKSEAESLEGDFAQNMTELYNRYLRSLYIK